MKFLSLHFGDLLENQTDSRCDHDCRSQLTQQPPSPRCNDEVGDFFQTFPRRLDLQALRIKVFTRGRACSVTPVITIADR